MRKNIESTVLYLLWKTRIMQWRVNYILFFAISISGCSSNPSKSTDSQISLPDTPSEASNPSDSPADFPNALESPLIPSNQNTVMSELSEEIVAQDFVSVVSQVPQFSSLDTRFILSGSNRPFTDALTSQLAREGYGSTIDNGSAVQVGQGVIHETTYSPFNSNVESDIERIATVNISLGDIKFMRRYAVLSRGDIKPVSPMLSIGVNSNSYSVDDTIFFTSIPDANTPVVAQQNAKTIQNEVKSRTETVAVKSLSPGPLPLNETQNYREIGESNYTEIFDTYTLIDKYVIEFGNDSTELSSGEELILDIALRKYNPATDIISIIGSSHGQSSTPNAQKELAQGRVEQVHEILLERDIPRDSVYSESSWASTYYDDVLPRRGVVFQLLRSET